MLPCACSTRALEVFVKDFAGIRLRQPRPHIHFNQQRRFSTRPPSRQLESIVASAHLDDAFLPFDTNTRKAKHSNRTPKSPSNENAVRQRNPEELDEEWHAEIEIDSQWTHEVGVAHDGKSASLNDSKEAFQQSESTDLNVSRAELSVSSVDKVSLHGLHSSIVQATPALMIPLLPSQTTLESSKSRVQSRRERKRRRIEAGEFAKYRKPKEGFADGVTDGERTQSVLEKIEALDGTSVATEEHPGKRKAIGTSRESRHGQQPKTTASVNVRNPRTRAARINWEKKMDTHGMTRRAKERESKGESKDSKSNEPAKPQIKRSKESWQVQKQALQRKFGEKNWQPRKRLSPDTLEGIRALHASNPGSYTTETLSEHFEISPEAIRRILKSKWRPSVDEIDERRIRWERRGVKKWTEMAEQGVRPPAKWRAMGIKYQQSGEGQKKTRGRKEEEYVQWEGGDDVRSRQSFAGRIL